MNTYLPILSYTEIRDLGSIFRTAGKHGILVLHLENSNYLQHTRGMIV